MNMINLVSIEFDFNCMGSIIILYLISHSLAIITLITEFKINFLFVCKLPICNIRIQQIDNNLLMALNSNQREKYWLERINNELKPKLHTLSSFQQVRITYIIQNKKNFIWSLTGKNIQRVIQINIFVSQCLCFKNFVIINYDIHKNKLSQLLSVIQKRSQFQMTNQLNIFTSQRFQSQKLQTVQLMNNICKQLNRYITLKTLLKTFKYQCKSPLIT
ncbi:unnamed protein product [Paramecium octaurelia]|uniref:Transmembrane protein n=1 Tax=Paramecium octaurelia TaxID=43137 RepID=A0A8S1UMG9_PAROT|nr:unnamed protein product [Paramecium octaurelia]